MQRRASLFFSIVLALAAPGCLVFDESLYLARERDAAVDAGADLDAQVGEDAGAADAGPAPDGGLPSVALADDCTGTVPELVLESGVSVQRAFDTRGLTNDFASLGCTGRPQAGPDGFFAVEMTAGERWHFHVRRQGTGADPVIFVLDGMCLDLACDPPNALDACRADSDEHLSLVAGMTGTYYVGLDSGNVDGFAGRVEVFRPVCGDGVQTHGESCEPGVTPVVDCTTDCHARLVDGASEVEVNDDSYMANLLATTAGVPLTVTGRIGSLCESDVFAIDVPAGGAISADLLTAGGAACPSGTLTTELQLLAPDGIVVRGEGALRSGACPSIDPTPDTFARGLAAGRYYVRVYALNDIVDRPFDYQLRVTVTTP